MNTNSRQHGHDRVTVNMNLDTNVLTANDAYMLILSDAQQRSPASSPARSPV